MIRKGREKEIREIDKKIKEVNAWYSRTITLIGKTKIKSWKGVAILAFIGGSVTAILFLVSANLETDSDASRSRSPLMKNIKSAGCVADGILSDYGGKSEIEVEMIKRSECKYLHRSLETWAHPPDFEKAQKIMSDIKEKKPNMIFGMFLAEAVGVNSSFYFPEEERYFNFSKMCKDRSYGFWGEGTCRGNFGSSEYRKYLKYITEEAIDIGIESFLFGQIFFQDNGTGWRSWSKDIVKDMRSYASEKGKNIVIGAQTNNIKDEKYLRIFDFVEGGVGLDSRGWVEEGPCFSRRSDLSGDRCWALLWHEEFKKKANDVIVHLDWSGFYDDDMSIFARLSKEERRETTDRLYRHFKKKDVGFMLPYFAVINENNGSCYGPARNYYSASKDYSCQDEDGFNKIIKRFSLKNEAKFLSQDVFLEMTAGRSYRAEIKFKNTGDSFWKKGDNFRLGSQNPEDNDRWGKARADLDSEEVIQPGSEATFVFEVKAPEKPGKYNFQWQMVDEGSQWFGEKSKNLEISVAPRNIL